MAQECDECGVTFDGVEYQAEAEVLKVLNQVQKDNETLKTDAVNQKNTLSKVEAERDTLKDEITTLKDEIKALKADKEDPKKVTEKVKALLRVRSVAEKLKVEVKEDMSEEDIMRASIMARYPKTSLEGKDIVYIQARFDGIVEMLEEEADAQNRTVGNKLSTEKNVKKDSAEEARKHMIERTREEYKRKVS